MSEYSDCSMSSSVDSFSTSSSLTDTDEVLRGVRAVAGGLGALRDDHILILENLHQAKVAREEAQSGAKEGECISEMNYSSRYTAVWA